MFNYAFVWALNIYLLTNLSCKYPFGPVIWPVGWANVIPDNGFGVCRFVVPTGWPFGPKVVTGNIFGKVGNVTPGVIVDGGFNFEGSTENKSKAVSI